MTASVEWNNSFLPSLSTDELNYSTDSETKKNKVNVHGSKRIRIPYQNEVNPLVLRNSCKENYELPITDRENWWREALRETPGPSKYDPGLYLTEQTVKRNGITTSHFVGEGRAQECQKYNKGAVLLPGAYELKDDLASRLDKTLNNYTFKDSGRTRDIAQIFYKDKHINVSPNAYKMEEHLSVKVDNKNVRHPSFRSMTSRFPTGDFAPREGPPPGFYESPVQSSKRAVRSSFLSKTPRFNSSHTRVPGPGTYEKTFQFPQPQTIERMAKRHGIFFSSDYQY